MSEDLSSEDDGLFYPIVDIQEGVPATECVKNIESPIDSKAEKIFHRKSSRRKLDDDILLSYELDRISKEKQREIVYTKKNKLSTKTLKRLFKKSKKTSEKHKKKTIEDQPVISENGFEFCTLDDVLEIKQEVLSDAEEKADDESEDDLPLSQLESNKLPTGRGNKTKAYSVSSAKDDSSFDDRKVKKLTIKKIKKIKKEIIEEEDEIMQEPPENLVYKCTECDEILKNAAKFKSHNKKVHQRPHFCNICLKAFKKVSHLIEHRKCHTVIRPFGCNMCDKTFKASPSLKKHIRIIHSEPDSSERKPFSCHICQKGLSSATCLEEHIRLHTGEKPTNCELCGKLFTRERDMKLHMNLHQESWKCDLCQRCFITPFKLKEHYRIHTGELPYECDKCDRKFARVSDFRYHIGTHLGLKPFSCNMCGMRFTTSSSVNRHQLNMHQVGPKHFRCEHCPKRFHTQARLNAHAKHHEHKERFACTLCPATRNTPAELARHVAVHGGEFRCDTCHRDCSSAARLAAHATRHELAGKPYACFVCSLGYRSAQSLNKHLATVHRDEDVPKIAPQHLCTLCGQVFELKDKLNRHLKDSHVVLVIGDIINLEPPKDGEVVGPKESVLPNIDNVRANEQIEVNDTTEPIDGKREQVTHEVNEECLKTNEQLDSKTNIILAEDNTEELAKECNETVFKDKEVKNNKDDVPAVKKESKIVEKINEVVNNDVNLNLPDKTVKTSTEGVRINVAKNLFDREDVTEDTAMVCESKKAEEMCALNDDSKARQVRHDDQMNLSDREQKKKDSLGVATEAVRNLSANVSTDAKQKYVPPRLPYESYMRSYSEMVPDLNQHSRLIPPNSYINNEESIKPFETYREHNLNSWLLAKNAEKTAAHRQFVRYNDLRQQHIEMPGQLNYGSLNQRLQRQHDNAPQNELREFANEQKYQIDEGKNPADFIRGYPHQNVRDFNVGPHAFSSPNIQSQTPHYPHNFFRDFRHLQQRMFGPGGVQNFPPNLSAMDMTRQPHPMSPYPAGQLRSDASSPRQSFDDLSSPIANSPSYQSGLARSVPNVDGSKEGNQPYDVRVATT